MRISTLLFRVLLTLLGPAIAASLYIYNYPYFHGCHFPAPAATNSGIATRLAPFRLLAYGDPQLEGDTSLPDPSAPWLPTLDTVYTHLNYPTAVELPGLLVVDILSILFHDVPKLLRGFRKHIDLVGNDFYLAHIHRTLYKHSRPTHVSVLGDLLGSQWISDGEFERRARRFWKTVFRGTEKVPDRLTNGAQETLSSTPGEWSRYLINVAGNHDIGYAGDIGPERIERFEDAFGRVNWAVDFTLPSHDYGIAQQAPSLRIVVLNTMNLDSPAWSKDLQANTNEFLAQQIEHVVNNTTTSRHATVLLTHIPLFKEEGLCTDGPFWTYFPSENGNGVAEQNHLSDEASVRLLDLFRHRGGIVLNGHDHEGCHTWHFRHEEDDEATAAGGLRPDSIIGDEWATTLYETMLEVSKVSAQIDAGVPVPTGIEEVTVRSMMGSYGGNAGLLSAWFDTSGGKWVFEYRDCVFGVQHIWWAVHGLDLVTVLTGVSWLVSLMV